MVTPHDTRAEFRPGRDSVWRRRCGCGGLQTQRFEAETLAVEPRARRRLCRHDGRRDGRSVGLMQTRHAVLCVTTVPCSVPPPAEGLARTGVQVKLPRRY